MKTSWRGRLGRAALGACAAAALIASAVPASAASGGAPPVVATDHGLVRGTEADGVRTYEGIPFAAPPKGALRWTAPQPAPRWAGVRDATKPQSPCPQAPGEVPGGSVEEDCLYLNVTTPAAKQHKPRPVIVWIHGGGYTNGAGSSYDANRLASKGNAVVITINYRLGVFGNLTYPGLKDGGTFGLLDQLAALKWARANARAFGGDPHNVTAAGESAGGMSICALLTSPKAKGAFDKGVMQSGSCLLHWTKNTWYPGLPGFKPYYAAKDAQEFATEGAAALQCTDAATAVDCLRGKEVEKLLALEVPFNAPSYDNSLLPRDPAEALRAGRFQRMPLLSGGNRDEANGSAAAIEAAGHLTEDAYQGLLADSFGADAPKVAARYPSSAYQSPAAAWGAVATDRAWACPTLEGNRLLAKRTRTYGYEFADRTAPPITPAPPGFPTGASHAFDLPYLFDLGGQHLLTTPAQEKLADQMIASWTGFARTGHAPWPRLRASADVPYVQSLDHDPAGADMAERHQCDLWSTIP
ncbi:carboxylesterase/lipase family protein [Tenggerimyces flavus]|uniref:Carboxylesterase/lipase family protein n=1 Tax=Tenggerimyces flavus TaxID=1708749 RepID=A0ABV7YDH1_9ACTN|nr:carboxylesterase family protein [Tenggerimyces flavus]MBM7787861.1 para-nitrobenzyl esterase [Tenggerimyces flavus]